MTIIWQTTDQTLADTPPPTYNYDDYSGMIWINVTTGIQYFGSVSNWIPVDPAHNMTVQREDIDLMTNMGGNMVRGLPYNLSLKRLLHCHNDKIEMIQDEINVLPDIQKK